MCPKQFGLEEQPYPASNKAANADCPLMSLPHRVVEKGMGCYCPFCGFIKKAWGKCKGFIRFSKPLSQSPNFLMPPLEGWGTLSSLLASLSVPPCMEGVSFPSTSTSCNAAYLPDFQLQCAVRSHFHRM